MNGTKDYGFLNGERIIFQPINLAHLPLYEKWGNDEDVRKYRRYFVPRSAEKIKKRYIDSIASSTKYSFEILHKLDEIPIGICNLHEIHWINRTAEIGLFIGDKKYWGQGFGTEIVEMLVHYGFHTLNLRKLRAVVYSPNLSSKKIFEKLGFDLEATLKNEEFIDQEYIDFLFYAKYAHKSP